MMEYLENRRLLSLMVTVDSKGVLNIQGSAGKDVITLNQTDTLFVVHINDALFSIPFSGIKSIRVLGDKGNDSISADSTVTKPIRMYGGVGNDTLSGGNSPCTLVGEAGNDLLIGGTSRDFFQGGVGKDTVSYSGRLNGLTISLDGIANDGEALEKDNVSADIEIVKGGKSDDLITGNNKANTLIGGNGNDTLYGLGGADVLSGGEGDDALYGGAGDDILLGIDLSSADTINGGDGSDSYTIDSVLGITDTLLGVETELSVLETVP